MTLSLLAKLGVFAALVVLLFDGVSVGKAAWGAEDDASAAARAARVAFEETESPQKAYDAAVAELEDDGSSIDPASMSFDEDGGVTLVVTREASTVLLKRVREQWTELSMSASASRPS